MISAPSFINAVAASLSELVNTRHTSPCVPTIKFCYVLYIGLGLQSITLLIKGSYNDRPTTVNLCTTDSSQAFDKVNRNALSCSVHQAYEK